VSRDIGIVSPGAMGAAVGRSLVGVGHHVVVALGGRSTRSVARAREAGLDDVGTLQRLADESDLVVSIVPPASALEVATMLARAGNRRPGWTLVDANAISPMRAREVAETVVRSGGRYVDGGIIGGPPRPGSRTELFVSGEGASSVAAALGTVELVVTDLGPDPTAASALKMCYASWSKGTAALLLEIRALARSRGVDEALVQLWERTQPSVLARSNEQAGVAARAWRWVDEMDEIARTFEASGLPGGAAAAASLLYERLAAFKDAEGSPSLAELLGAILP
jgi:3-hydroxyisobutyrate dehydrogenase-like beta-hydroxyacid dehydrogenase